MLRVICALGESVRIRPGERIPLDGVLESAVIGLPHPDFGEAVFAVLAARKGADLSADAALAAIRDKLARFKQPKGAVVVDDLPRNTMGKVQKNLLRQTYADWFNR